MIVTRFLYYQLSFLFFVVLCGQAQLQQYNEEWRWAHFTTETGLPSNNVSDVIEASDGIPWAATATGPMWYDGFRWRSVNDPSSFPALRPSCMVPDSNGTILFITGWQIYIGDTNRCTLLDPIIHKTVTQANAIIPVGNQTYMIADNTDLYSYRNGILEQVEIPSSFFPSGKRMFLTSSGGIWINTNTGIYRWNGTAWVHKLKASTAPFHIFDIVEGVNKPALVSIAHPMNFRGLWEMNPDKFPVRVVEEGAEFLKAMNTSPTGEAIAVYRSGSVRIGKNGKWTTLEDTPHHLRNASALKFNKNGNLWVCSETGLHLYKQTDRRWEYWKHPFPNPLNTVNEILMSRDSSIWLGTEDGIEVHRVNGLVQSFREINGTRLYVVTGLCEDNEGGIWISSGGWFDGAYRWDGRQWKHFGVSNGLAVRRIHKIRKDRKGRLWFLGLGGGTKGSTDDPGAYLFSNGRFTRWGKPEGLLSGRVYAFQEGMDGALWFGTAAGICRWNNGTWTYWTKENGLKLPRIFTLDVDKNDVVWFGHQHEGVGSINGDDSVRYYTEADGLISDNVWEVKPDESGRLWVSTTQGVSCYRDGEWSSFGQSGGLSYAMVWPILPMLNKVYFGTAGNGVSILHLGNHNTQHPEIEIAPPVVEDDHAFVQWRPLSFWGEIPSEKILTRFRVDEGLWSGWSAQHRFTKSNLSVGNHRVQVQAKGLFGNYDHAGQSTAFTINGPFYKRAEFILPLFIMSIAVVVLGAVVIVRKRQHNNALRDREARLRILTETTSSAMFIHNGGSFQFVNSSAESLIGCTRNELVGMSFHDIVHPDSRGVMKELEHALINDKSLPYRSELKIVTKDGKERWADVTVGRIQHDDHQAILVTAFDITGRKQAEQKLIAYQEKLQSLASDLVVTEERERRQMATFLHDSICQSLIFCKMKLEALREAKSEQETVTLVTEIDAIVDRSIDDTRTLTFELSPPILYELGFEPAIQWLVEHMYHHFNLRVSLTNDGADKPLAEDIRVVLFQSVREILVNVVKHAQTADAFVSLEKINDSIRIVIEDHGCGFDPSHNNTHASHHGGFGLFSIRERLEYLNGNMTIHSTVGFGTKVTLTAPLKHAKTEG